MAKSLQTETHAILSPSGAYRWANCSASMQAIRKAEEQGIIPRDETNEFAEQGTHAHEIAGKILHGPDWFDHDHFETPDQEEFLPVYVNYINDVSIANPGMTWKFEQKVNPARYVKTNHCKGTADAIGILSDKVVYVVDYKHGEHVVVEVEDNFQLILYGLGALVKLHKLKYNVRKLKIVLAIVQPRAWHRDGVIREWETNYKELMRWARWFAKRAAEALGPNPEFSPDTEIQCRFCPIQGCCRALAEQELSVAREVFTTIDDTEAELKNPDLLTRAELSSLLKQLPGLKKWATQISQHALSRMESGEQIPYWDLKEKEGNRQWAVPEDELKLFFDKDVLYENKLRSPAQVEKLAGKNSVKEFTTREVTGHTIVETNDPHDSDESIPFDEVKDG
jgi:hypothetical protein